MAVGDPTANFGWNLPNDQGDSGTWGAILRQILGEADTASAAPNGGIDKILKAAKDTAEAAMPKAGGVFTGEIDILTARYELVGLGAAISGTVTLDLDEGNFFHGTLGGNVTFAFANVPADGVFIVLELQDGGNHTVTWPASIKWANGVEPTLTTDGLDVLTFFTRDSGANWRGALAMEDVS